MSKAQASGSLNYPGSPPAIFKTTKSSSVMCRTLSQDYIYGYCVDVLSGMFMAAKNEVQISEELLLNPCFDARYHYEMDNPTRISSHSTDVAQCSTADIIFFVRIKN